MCALYPVAVYDEYFNLERETEMCVRITVNQWVMAAIAVMINEALIIVLILGFGRLVKHLGCAHLQRE